MPGFPTKNLPGESTGPRGVGVRNQYQGSGSFRGRIDSSTDEPIKPNDGSVVDSKVGQVQSASQDPPVTMAELVRDVSVLANEVLELRREKTAIKESLKEMTWTVTFRPQVDASGAFKVQTLDIPTSLSADSIREVQGGSSTAEMKKEKSDIDTTSHTSKGTAFRNGNASGNFWKKAEHLQPSNKDSKYDGAGWRPIAVRKFEPLSADKVSCIPGASQMEGFSYEFLCGYLGENEYSPGFYYTPSEKDAGKRTVPWYGLNNRFEPCLPEKPGAHGAKLTVFFNEEGDKDDHNAPSYEKIPVFVCSSNWASGQHNNFFFYFGSYSQNRWSDKLDYDRMVEMVNTRVKGHWADQLTSPGRPQWLTKALMKHFWPPPAYEGTIPTSFNTGSNQFSQQAVAEHIRDLKDWEDEASTKVDRLKKEDILNAFEMADADFSEPGLRMYWEYLECVDWDKNFYEALVKRKHNPYCLRD
ncbi:MAG: hypothetical protein M1821_007876 [Bathelium mastoideum]|nr:MAG: hypothetical protein M1821_007876 [Bathelium mastoideum]